MAKTGQNSVDPNEGGSMGIYAGVSYWVVEKDGRRYISPDPQFLGMFTENGADLRLLDDIGDKDPDEVMEALFATMKKPE